MPKILHLGLSVEGFSAPGYEVVHFPIIEIIPYAKEAVLESLKKIESASHLIITSQTTIRLLETYFSEKQKQSAQALPTLAVGKATYKSLLATGYQNVCCAPIACGEGIVAMMKEIKEPATFFYPHSDLARPLIEIEGRKKGHKVEGFSLYTTIATTKPLIDWTSFDEIFFTSSSTVDSFFKLYGELPPLEKCRAIGFLTKKTVLKRKLCL